MDSQIPWSLAQLQENLFGKKSYHVPRVNTGMTAEPLTPVIRSVLGRPA